MPYDDESAQNAVSRETDEPVSIRLRTAGDIASFENDYATEATPLAAAAEHTLLARGAAGNRPPLPRPASTRVIVSANQKGGVGKTTSTVNVAAALAQLGLRVLVIDLDPQGNASTALNIEHRRGVPSTYDLLVDGATVADVVQACPDQDRLWVVPATIDLAGAEIELVAAFSRELKLRKALDSAQSEFDYVLIDCPPSLGLLTINALSAAREVVVPIQCEYYALEGLGQLLKNINLVQSSLNPNLSLTGIVLTMYDSRTRLAEQVAGEVRSHFPGKVFSPPVPRSVRLSEAPSFGQPIALYDPRSRGAQAYLRVSWQLAARRIGWEEEEPEESDDPHVIRPDEPEYAWEGITGQKSIEGEE